MGEGENVTSVVRHMADTNGTALPYSVFSDAGHSAAAAPGEVVFSGDINAPIPQAIPVYEQIPASSSSLGCSGTSRQANGEKPHEKYH